MGKEMRNEGREIQLAFPTEAIVKNSRSGCGVVWCVCVLSVVCLVKGLHTLCGAHFEK